MRIPVRIRRILVSVGVVGCLLVGAVSIRAAAAWTAASSPLAVRPPSIESLKASLVDEQARSAQLRAQLVELSAGSADLTAALATARARIATDADQATALQASLDAAKTKLAALEASIRRAQTAGPSGTSTKATFTGSSAAHETEDESEAEDD